MIPGPLPKEEMGLTIGSRLLVGASDSICGSTEVEKLLIGTERKRTNNFPPDWESS